MKAIGLMCFADLDKAFDGWRWSFQEGFAVDNQEKRCTGVDGESGDEPL